MSGATHATAGPAANPVLVATVGTNDGVDIDLADVNAVHVSRLTSGTYDIVVRDRSRLHNFHLASNTDPTVDFRTELDFVGEMTFTVTFRDETRYAYACEPHWQTMNGEFFVVLAAGSASSRGAASSAAGAESRRHAPRQAVRRQARASTPGVTGSSFRTARAARTSTSRAAA